CCSGWPDSWRRRCRGRTGTRRRGTTPARLRLTMTESGRILRDRDWMRMSGTEQLLILVGVPVVVVAVVWALASIGGPHAKKRYRPGRPYDFRPVWYLANHR